MACDGHKGVRGLEMEAGLEVLETGLLVSSKIESHVSTREIESHG